MNKKGVVIEDVLPNTIGAEMEIKKGDKILSVNGEPIHDILEYKFLTADDYIELEIEDTLGEVTICEIEKDFDEDLGILFEGIIDETKSCTNNCIFCFIDQLPQNMRKTLYFKDDDTRLSFLQGNFVTLTNLKEEDIRKIVKYRISPINISIHTTDLELRKKMLNNRFAGNLLKYLKILCEGDIEVKGQIVLCKDINDGENLKRTIEDLAEFYPQMSCLAVVPIGLTKHRQGLREMKPFDEGSALKTIDIVEKLQAELSHKIGGRFVHLSDEFYCLAGKELPGYETYEDFSQLENGVGLLKLFENNIDEGLKTVEKKCHQEVKGTVVTGEYAYPYIESAVAKIKKKYDNINISTLSIHNDFFGPLIKVAGLLTGKDIIAKLRGKNIGDYVFITKSMLKADENILLDDITVKELEKALGVTVVICQEDGSDFIDKMLLSSTIGTKKEEI